MSVRTLKFYLLVFSLVLASGSLTPVDASAGGFWARCSAALQSAFYANRQPAESQNANIPAAMLEYADDFAVMDVGDYFSVPEEGHQFAYVSVFPRLIKHLRDDHHLSKDDVNDLLVQLKVKVLDVLSQDNELKIVAAFADFKNLRFALPEDSDMERFQNRVAVATKRFENDILNEGGPVAEALLAVKQSPRFRSWGTVGAAQQPAAANVVGKFLSNHAELGIGSIQAEEVWPLVVEKVHNVNRLRKKLVETFRAFETEEIRGSLVDSENSVLSLALMNLLRKTPAAELREAIEAKFDISIKEETRMMLLQYKSDLPAFVPANQYREKDVVHLEDVETSNLTATKVARLASDYIVITDVKGVGGQHLFELQKAITRVSEKWSQGRINYEDFLQGVEVLENEGFGPSLHRLRKELDRSEVLGEAGLPGQMVFTDFSGDERVRFYQGDMPKVESIDRFRRYLGNEQRAIIISLRGPMNERISDKAMSLLEERAFFLSKRLEEHFPEALFTVETFIGANATLHFQIYASSASTKEAIQELLDEGLEFEMRSSFEAEAEETNSSFQNLSRRAMGGLPKLRIEVSYQD